MREGVLVITQKEIFNDFSEYWYFAKCLDESQRDIIFNSLPEEQQEKLQESYEKGGWEDVFIRNQTDKLLSELIEKYNIDILKVKTKVISGKSHYMSVRDWDIVVETFTPFEVDHTYYILGGLHADQVDDNTILITKE